MLKPLPVIPHGHRPQVLLVGNGINLLFGDRSWKKMIQDEMVISQAPIVYQDIKPMPATMQIVLATRDRVDERLREIGDGLAYMDMTGERTAFLREVLAMPVESILTVNYSLELEYAAGLPQRVAAYRSELKRTRDLYESKEPFRVYQYFDCGGKQIWHVHGDVAKLSSMVMGHYHYGMLIREIQDYTAEMTRRYRACRSGCLDYQPYSWIDSFLMGDVYILGMGMYLCEADLWWLLCCKKRNFPDTRVCFYELTKEDDRQKLMLMEAYNVEVVRGIEGEYKRQMPFYRRCMEDIRQRIERARG